MSWLAAATLGAGVVGALANKSASDKAVESSDLWKARQYEQTEKWNQIAQGNWNTQMTKAIQLRAQDARSAGISALAAMGAPGTAPPQFNIAQGTTSGPYSTRSPLGEIANSALAAAHVYQAQQQQEQVQATRAQTEKTRQEIDALRIQNYGMRNQILWDQIYREKDRLNDPGIRREPMYGKYYDNRGELGDLGDGEVFLVLPEIAESLEGLGATGLGVFGTVGNRMDQLTRPIEDGSIKYRFMPEY